MVMANAVSKYDDVIDSRDVIARIEELQEWRDAAIEKRSELGEQITADGSDLDAIQILQAQIWTDADGTEYGETPDFSTEEADELKILLALQSEAEGSPDWRHGETLIRDSYFKEYAQELAEDIGAIDKDAKWPNTCIDWDQAARELKYDYFTVDFEDIEYWIRS